MAAHPALHALQVTFANILQDNPPSPKESALKDFTRISQVSRPASNAIVIISVLRARQLADTVKPVNTHQAI